MGGQVRVQSNPQSFRNAASTWIYPWTGWMDDSRTLIEGGAEDVVGWARIADVVERERIGEDKGPMEEFAGKSAEVGV
jgi:hypothetical protein